MQVLVEESEYARLQKAAQRKGMTLAEWVRLALRAACRSEPEGGSEKKLLAIRSAARNSFPTGDIDQMLSEIDRGYGES